MRRTIYSILLAVLAVCAPAFAQEAIIIGPYVNSSGVTQGSIRLPASSYINFGATTGEAGYGLRDSGTNIEFKNSGGAWTSFNAGAATNFWARTGTVLSAATAGDTLSIAAAGPHAIGGSAVNYAQMRWTGTLTSGGASSVATGIYYDTVIAAAAGDTTYVAGQYWNSTMSTPGSGETFALLAQARFSEPQITVGAGDTVTESATVYIATAATEATRNYSLYNDSTTLSRFDGPITIGSTGRSSKLTTGLSLYQGAADDEILSFASSDVAHGMTDLADTDTWGAFSKQSASVGGVQLSGFGESSLGVKLSGYVTSENTTKGATGRAAIEIAGLLKSGTTAGAMSANANLLALFNAVSTSAVWLADTDGDTWQGGTVTAVGTVLSGTMQAATGKLTTLPTHADNAAAAGAGLTAGMLYKTAAGIVMVVY